MNADDDTGAMLAEQLDRLFTREVDRETLAALESGSGKLPLWAVVDDLGAAQALVSQADGGAGLGWYDMLPALLELGRHAAPVPLGETMIATAALVAAGVDVPAGPLAVAGAVFELDAQDRLTGFDAAVAWAPHAAAIVVVAQRDGRRFIALLPAAGTEPVATLGRIPSARVALNGVSVVVLARTDHGPLGLLPQLAVLRAAQMAGSLQAVLDQTVDYANLRVQFGKPIGKQQAIQQHLAELAMQTAAAQVAAQFGCRAMDGADPAAALFGAAVAKQRASRAASIGAAIAHQVFGAIGVTDEHVLHHHTRRLWQWRAEAGSEHAWAEHLGRQALRGGGHALWPSLVA